LSSWGPEGQPGIQGNEVLIFDKLLKVIRGTHKANIIIVVCTALSWIPDIFLYAPLQEKFQDDKVKEVNRKAREATLGCSEGIGFINELTNFTRMTKN